MSSSTSLQDALLEFANEHDWSKRKQIVERHHDLLLSDNAASMLDAAIAHNAQRPGLREVLKQCRTVLADCRAIGVNAAFVLSIGPSAGLMEALKDLLSADSPEAAQQTTVEQKDLLLTDEADWVLVALAHESSQEAFFVERIAHRRELLARCRSEGIEPAFADMLREEDRTTTALQALLHAISSEKQSEEVLRNYPDVLLTDQAIQQIGELATEPDLSPDVYRAVDAIRSLLTLARADGISTATITYLLPPFEQFITRCLFAMAKPEKPDPGRSFGVEDILRTQLDKIDSSFPEKLHEWSQTVMENTDADGLKIYFNSVSHLGKALGDLTIGNRALNQTASSACYMTANQFYQKNNQCESGAGAKGTGI